MKNVGGRRPWTAYMVRKFINYNAKEQKQRRGREYFYWGVEDKGALVGIVGIHPVLYGRPDTEGLSFVTIFLDSAHSGRRATIRSTLMSTKTTAPPSPCLRSWALPKWTAS